MKGIPMTSGPSEERERRIVINHAPESWRLIMQSGVGFACTVGVPIREFLSRQLDVADDAMAKIESILIDGMPVDDPDRTILPDACRLALAAGLPGAAGLAMRMDSGVKALRPGITYLREDETNPRPGEITLLLYALVLPLLADRILRNGIKVTLDQIKRYSAFSPDAPCVVGECEFPISEFIEKNATCSKNDCYILEVHFDPAL